MELQNMLKRSDLVFDKSQIEEIFRLIDIDRSHHLTVDEFQSLSKNENEKMKFRKIMREVRDATLKDGSKERSFNFIPLTFEGLLDYLFQKQSRQDCWGAIGKVDRFKFDEHNNVLPSSSY